MGFLTELWLPILLSAVAVFLVSSVIHMVLQIHNSDFSKLPAEEDLLAAMRTHGLEPGEYMFPCPASAADMATPEMIAKYEQGPVGQMVVVPNGPYAMGKALAQWFAFTVVISVFVAYLASFGIGADAGFMVVFRFTGTVAVLGYAFSTVTNSIWKGVSWVTTAKFVFDGVCYGLATGAVFGWLWPAA